MALVTIYQTNLGFLTNTRTGHYLSYRAAKPQTFCKLFFTFLQTALDLCIHPYLYLYCYKLLKTIQGTIFYCSKTGLVLKELSVSITRFS